MSKQTDTTKKASASQNCARQTQIAIEKEQQRETARSINRQAQALQEKPDDDAAYWRKRTDEYSLQLAHTHNHAEAMAEALRQIKSAMEHHFAPYDRHWCIDKATQALAAWESEAGQ